MYDVVLVGTNDQEQEYSSERTCIRHLGGSAAARAKRFACGAARKLGSSSAYYHMAV